MGNDNSDLQEIGKRANQKSPKNFINTSIIKLTSSTIIEDCKKMQKMIIKNYTY